MVLSGPGGVGESELAARRGPWLVVLDDVRDPAELRGLWPPGEVGQVVVMTRLPGLALPQDGLHVVGLDAFTED
ncbi:hypothetical protein ABZ816_02745 [Actinosynnema sp. NPDC047251]|uniref:hypothetical protein n=1 Tax=Saccharothrix espanaensis TaxID=103731 RepID=UPI0002F52664|nr:hypothetical protein [Saccharothrix espanaensis]